MKSDDKGSDSTDDTAGLALLLKGVPGKKRQALLGNIAETRAQEVVDDYLDKPLSGLIEDLPKLLYWQYIKDISLRSALGSMNEPSVAYGHQPRKNKKVTCPVEDCGKPAGGPKWGWFCEAHKDLPEREKKAARTARDLAREEAKKVSKSGRQASPKATRKR